MIEWSDTQRYTSAPSVLDENDIVLPTGMTFMQIFGMAGAVCESDHDSGIVVEVTNCSIVVEVTDCLTVVEVELVVDDVSVGCGGLFVSAGQPNSTAKNNAATKSVMKFFIFVYVTKLASGIRTLGGLPITVARLCRILTGFPDCDAEIFIAYLHNCVK